MLRLHRAGEVDVDIEGVVTFFELSDAFGYRLEARVVAAHKRVVTLS